METRRLGELVLDELTLKVPLTADAADGRELEIFARVVTKPGGEDLPYLLYLQGGPGFEAPRPCLDPLNPSWLAVALNHFRVVMLDQRGTGRSSVVDSRLVQEKSTDEAVEYLRHFRADGIVRDCEELRRFLGVEKWNVLGQSFGGFTTLHYLSTHPDSLDQVFFTGGLSAVGCPIEDVYQNCYRRTARNSRAYYRRFPQHRPVMENLVQRCRVGDIVLASGEVVSETRLRSLGHLLGSDSGWASLYNLLELDPDSDAFAYDLAALLPFSPRNPLYYVLHESCYADGLVTNWAAERSLPAEFRDDVTLLTGEHVFREWLDTVPAFRPWKAVADKLATYDWPQLYDPEALKASQARGAAAVYVNDQYVPCDFSMDTAALIPGVQLLVTSEYEHSGLHSGAGVVLEHLLDLAAGRRVR